MADTDVSIQTVDPIFKDQTVQEEDGMSETSVNNYKSALRNI
jgi:hypothetical protein